MINLMRLCLEVLEIVFLQCNASGAVGGHPASWLPESRLQSNLVDIRGSHDRASVDVWEGHPPHRHGCTFRMVELVDERDVQLAD